MRRPRVRERDAPEQSLPNVVLIMMDSLGSSDSGPYGATDIQTPHLDRLAGDGVLLTQRYSNDPVCTPSCAALRWAFTLAGSGWKTTYESPSLTEGSRHQRPQWPNYSRQMVTPPVHSGNGIWCSDPNTAQAPVDSMSSSDFFISRSNIFLTGQ